MGDGDDDRGRLHALRAPGDRLPRRAGAPHADLDERDARSRGGERQARDLHGRPARSPPRADGRRLCGLRGRRAGRVGDRRDDRCAVVLVGRARDRHRAARADRRLRREHRAGCDQVRRVGAARLQHRRARRLRERLRAHRARGRAGAGAATVGRAAGHLRPARRPRALERAGRLRASRRQRAARAQGARRARPGRLRAGEDRRVGRLHGGADPGVRAGRRAGGRLRRRLVPDPRLERLHGRHRAHGRPRVREGRPALPREPPPRARR